MSENNIKLEGAELDAYLAKRFPSTNLPKLIDELGSPSAFDSWSNYMGEKPSDTLYCVLGRNRDSSMLTNSNWDCAVQMFQESELPYDITRVGHWLCGWIEYLSVDINDKEAFKMGEEIEASLANYPCLDEEDYSRREYEDLLQLIELEYDDDFNVGEDFDDWDDIAFYLNENGYYHGEGCYPTSAEIQKAMWECYVKDRVIDIARDLAVGESIIEGSWEISRITDVEATAHFDCEDEPRMLYVFRDHPNQMKLTLN